ncbi:MAG: hypothetical protein OSA98_08285 [Rubripirellula sp.]|nr:hypothetical protein [Rubripirellula sp.]
MDKVIFLSSAAAVALLTLTTLYRHSTTAAFTWGRKLNCSDLASKGQTQDNGKQVM